MKKAILLLAGFVIFGFNIKAQTVTDYDGNVYDTVVIGPQVWLKENLKVTHYSDGADIPNVADNTSWAALTTGARCYYANDSSANDSVYGALYNWYAVNNSGNICPEGWHASTYGEWTAAETFLGGISVAGGKMKESGTLHWNNPNTGADNSSGFTGLPGGFRDQAGTFQTIHENGLWWTSTGSGSSAWSLYFWYLFAGVDANAAPKKFGMSVRCVKDISTGLGNMNEVKKTQIYPNPARDRFTVECAGNQVQYLLVYNLFGEMVLQNLITKRTNEINISSLPAGIYIIKFFGDQGIMQQKLIKE
jgi:uncharacterized protein (TIGR02145 family)